VNTNLPSLASEGAESSLPPSLARRAAEGSRYVLVGVFVNIVLTIAKFAGGILGHSSALIADATESLLDIFSSTMTWAAIKLSAAPPDAKHPFGHGKIESLAAFLGALMLMLAGVLLAWEAVNGLLSPGKHPVPAWYTFFIVLSVVGIKEALFHVFAKKAREIESSALLTDAWHHRSDAIASIGTTTGVGIAIVTGWVVFDKIAALLCCVLIFYNGFKMLRNSLGEVLDEQMPDDFLHNVRQSIEEVPGVICVEKCRIRKSGLCRIADIHIHVNPEISVAEGHVIAHAAKDHVKQLGKNITDVTIHVEPANAEEDE